MAGLPAGKDVRTVRVAGGIAWRALRRPDRHAAQDQTLPPGDVLGAGTATGGSGLTLDRRLCAGDKIEMEAGPIGVLRNTVGTPNVRKDR